MLLHWLQHQRSRFAAWKQRCCCTCYICRGSNDRTKEVLMKEFYSTDSHTEYKWQKVTILPKLAHDQLKCYLLWKTNKKKSQKEEEAVSSKLKRHLESDYPQSWFGVCCHLLANGVTLWKQGRELDGGPLKLRWHEEIFTQTSGKAQARPFAALFFFVAKLREQTTTILVTFLYVLGIMATFHLHKCTFMINTKYLLKQGQHSWTCGSVTD